VLEPSYPVSALMFWDGEFVFRGISSLGQPFIPRFNRIKVPLSYIKRSHHHLQMFQRDIPSLSVSKYERSRIQKTGQEGGLGATVYGGSRFPLGWRTRGGASRQTRGIHQGTQTRSSSPVATPPYSDTQQTPYSDMGTETQPPPSRGHRA
jgi:hypothetical protein